MRHTRSSSWREPTGTRWGFSKIDIGSSHLKCRVQLYNRWRFISPLGSLCKRYFYKGGRRARVFLRAFARSLASRRAAGRTTIVASELGGHVRPKESIDKERRAISPDVDSLPNKRRQAEIALRLFFRVCIPQSAASAPWRHGRRGGLLWLLKCTREEEAEDIRSQPERGREREREREKYSREISSLFTLHILFALRIFAFCLLKECTYIHIYFVLSAKIS